MFGGFYFGYFVLGVDIWGATAPTRTDPSIDGQYTRTSQPVGTFSAVTIDQYKYIPDFTPVGGYERIK